MILLYSICSLFSYIFYDGDVNFGIARSLYKWTSNNTFSFFSFFFSCLQISCVFPPSCKSRSFPDTLTLPLVRVSHRGTPLYHSFPEMAIFYLSENILPIPVLHFGPKDYPPTFFLQMIFIIASPPLPDNISLAWEHITPIPNLFPLRMIPWLLQLRPRKFCGSYSPLLKLAVYLWLL